MSHFEYRNQDGGRFTAQPLPGVPYVLLKTDPEGCAVPLDRLEEVIAGQRDMARQAGQHATLTAIAGTYPPAGDRGCQCEGDITCDPHLTALQPLDEP